MSYKNIFQKLTPTNKADMRIYEEALNYVFEDPNIKNVGISGAYSAGKSSVIETYKILKPDIKFMHISLSYFQPTSTSKSQTPEQNESVLEGKILNQLIHQIDPTKIAQTNFRVKRQLSQTKIWSLAMIIFIFILLILYIINFNKWSEFINTLTPKIISQILYFTTFESSVFFAGIACGMILFFMIYKIIKVQFNKNLFKGISVQGNTIEIFEQKEESYFDKYLNEVLYLFENSQANVIVFEDMDRYNSNQIFQRLREINTLINNRKRNNEKPLRFFYLLRDDIFVSKERTKFFDFIIPIVPVLDGSNSFDQLITHFQQGNIYNLFNEHFLQEISLYIDDMRILKNIYNEFLIYHKRISTTEQDANKLLAIVIYKNIFPRDFSELQLNSGFVYTLFSKKDQFIKEEVTLLRERISQLIRAIECAENEHLKNIEEINMVYDSRIQSLNRYYNNRKELEALEKEKKQRSENIKNKTSEHKNSLKHQISALEISISSLKHKKLYEIISKQNAESIFKVISTNEIGVISDFNDIKGSDYFALIKYLIRNGYIDETYPDYMTYFYENSLSRIDKIFLRSVTDEDAKDYKYQLKNPNMILQRLSIASFDKEEVLNFDLLSYMLEHQESIDKDKTIKVFKQLRERKNFKFIDLYFESDRGIAPFIHMLNNIWPAAFSSILNESDFTENRKIRYALESIYHTDNEDLKMMNSQNVLTEFVSNSKDFLNIAEPNISRIIDAFKLLNIKFSDIDYDNANKELFREVYSHNFYIISFDLICLMIREIYGYTDKNDLIHKNCSIIFSQGNEPLVTYIKDNINNYIGMILEYCEGEILDSEEVVLYILNENSIEEEIKNKYIDNIKTNITNLKDIEDVSLWLKLLDKDLIIYSEENVIQYFCCSGNGFDKTLARFINEKGDSYTFNYDEIDNKFEKGNGSKFFNAVVKSVYLNIRSFTSILKSLHRRYNSFNIADISDSKMDVLIEQRIIIMTPEVLLFMRENYPEKIINFIKKNINVYVEDVISEKNFNIDEVIELLQTDIDDGYKLPLLEYTSNSISIMNNTYSDELKIYILKHNFNRNDIPELLKSYPVLVEKLQSAIEEIAKTNIVDIVENEFFVPFMLCKKLLALSAIHIEWRWKLFAVTVLHLKESECKECLVIMESKDLLSIFSERRRAIPITDVNKRILDIFIKKHWILGYDIDKKDDTIYRISSRRMGKQRTLPTRLL